MFFQAYISENPAALLLLKLIMVFRHDGNGVGKNYKNTAYINEQRIKGSKC